MARADYLGISEEAKVAISILASHLNDRNTLSVVRKSFGIVEALYEVADELTRPIGSPSLYLIGPSHEEPFFLPRPGKANIISFKSAAITRRQKGPVNVQKLNDEDKEQGERMSTKLGVDMTKAVDMCTALAVKACAANPVVGFIKVRNLRTYQIWLMASSFKPSGIPFRTELVVVDKVIYPKLIKG